MPSRDTKAARLGDALQLGMREREVRMVPGSTLWESMGGGDLTLEPEA